MALYKLVYTLDPRSVLTFKKDNRNDPLDALFGELSTKVCCDRLIKLDKSFNTLCIIISSEQIDKNEFERINTLISENSAFGPIAMQCSEILPDTEITGNSLSDEDREYLHSLVNISSAPLQPETSNFSVAPSDSDSQKSDVSIFEQIENLIAADELKAWAKEMNMLSEKQFSPELLQHSLMGMSYLVSINGGNGCTTFLRSIGSVLCHVLKKAKPVLNEFSVEPDKDLQDYNIDKILEKISAIKDNSENLYIFALHIDKLQNNTHIPSLLNLLRGLWENNNKAIFIFVLPYLESAALSEVHKKIEDILPNRILKSRPLLNEDYVQFFKLYFSKFNITISDGACALIPKKLAEEKTDGRFYSINTVYKICDEILYNKLKTSVFSDSNSLSEITEDDISALLNTPVYTDETLHSGMQQLDSLIALENVKNVIKEIIATIKMQRSMNTGIHSSMHMMFSGSPGTGKTVVARILGEIFREEKILSIGGFYEVSRKDLVGKYVGHTAPKTAEVCQAAYGSILFIDEAYTLDGGSENDYGKEAISTLIAEMENKRDDFVVIFAGYQKELERLFDLNPGLRDRIPYQVPFSNYSRTELEQIFYKMLPNEFRYSEEFKDASSEFFSNLSDELMQNPNFSNARFVRNLIERVLSKYALRTQMDNRNESEYQLLKSDFNLAISDSEFKKLNEKKRVSKIGFSL